ncbi:MULTISPECIES: Scr1 family TA system antitoxin-like transcriptional regulator [unclassified Streptomyces]|uniref:Scr1 family TA system antitoxin-like transcriptional regulator n=1 Tax=unclassified Streptomyces TaxID=2593676 RepID=UPI002D21DC0A|nr:MULTISPECIES: Scr1 family TA system antitoxin-like transcriptional regulator [unclassified Streptomyces]
MLEAAAVLAPGVCRRTPRGPAAPPVPRPPPRPAFPTLGLEFLNRIAAQPHITVHVLPHSAGAHPGVSGQFSILDFPDAPGAGTVYLERFTSDLYLEKRSEVRHFSAMFDHLQAQALNPERTHHFITRAAEDLRATGSLPGWP